MKMFHGGIAPLKCVLGSTLVAVGWTTVVAHAAPNPNQPNAQTAIVNVTIIMPPAASMTVSPVGFTTSSVDGETITEKTAGATIITNVDSLVYTQFSRVNGPAQWTGVSQVRQLKAGEHRINGIVRLTMFKVPNGIPRAPQTYYVSPNGTTSAPAMPAGPADADTATITIVPK